jgi:hypothetical protein
MISAVAHVNDEVVLFSTLGRYTEDLSAQLVPDTARLLSLTDGALLGDPLRESQKQPFTLGGLSCAPTEWVCMLADAETEGGVVHRFEFDPQSELSTASMVKLDTGVGLPPRGLGRF